MAKVCDHTSVGILVWKEDRLLLIERKRFPFGFAPPAGHVDDHGSFEDAARQELKEEVGLDMTNIELVLEGRKENECRREGGNWHYWKIYEVEATGEVIGSEDETKQTGFYSKDQLAFLAKRTEQYFEGNIPEDQWRDNPGLEPVWHEWLKELNII